MGNAVNFNGQWAWTKDTSRTTYEKHYYRHWLQKLLRQDLMLVAVSPSPVHLHFSIFAETLNLEIVAYFQHHVLGQKWSVSNEAVFSSCLENDFPVKSLAILNTNVVQNLQGWCSPVLSSHGRSGCVMCCALCCSVSPSWVGAEMLQACHHSQESILSRTWCWTSYKCYTYIYMYTSYKCLDAWSASAT